MIYGLYKKDDRHREDASRLDKIFLKLLRNLSGLKVPGEGRSTKYGCVRFLECGKKHLDLVSPDGGDILIEGLDDGGFEELAAACQTAEEDYSLGRAESYEIGAGTAKYLAGIFEYAYGQSITVLGCQVHIFGSDVVKLTQY